MGDTPLFSDFFLRHATSAPDAVAVEFRDQRMSFAELAGCSARLATELIRRGVGTGSIVGIAARPSLELPVAVLGTIRAGGAWLPLDPAYPAALLRHMVTDSGVRMAVADASSAGRVAAAGVEVLDPAPAMSAPIAGPTTTGPTTTGPTTGMDSPDLPRMRPDDLAYVIYTSGSTGRPKGVALTHGGLANLALAQFAAFGVTAGDRVAQFAPTSFDASVFEMVMALATGATLVLAPREDMPPGPGLADYLRQARVTHVTLPPSVLATLPDPRLPGADLPDLAMLVCAGEALPAPLAEQWSTGRHMFNAYGPTETTVWATIAELAPGGGKPTIGTAIQGAHALVVDERLRPAPAGTPGELAIGGRGVARGYLGRPGLTAQRFVPDPASAEPGARMYLTGDRVVQRPDGTLDFLGRIDHQVKVRGFRIEPDEVAARLREYPGVTDAVVTAHGSGAAAELLGYVTGSVDTAALRAHLVERLPAHMVPGALVVLDTMPLTPSGKIDRAALPAPDRAAGSPGQVPPATPTEQALARLLGELLGAERVGATDDFFGLGGHSLLAGKLAARVRAELGRELPLRQVYETPTVAGMAAALDSPQSLPTVAVPPIRAGSGEPAPAPLSFPQERIWFLNELSPGSLAYNAQATLRLRGPLDPGVLRRALTEVVRRHEVLRTAFQAVDGVPVQTPQPPMDVPLPLADLSGLPEAQREARAEELIAGAMADPFDLARPPLARWLLVRHSPTDHTVVHVEHHLVHDGWSFAVFLHELRALYTAFAAGQPSPLPEPAVHYTDFARWQRDWLRGDVLDEYLAFWTGELAGSPAALDLRTDRPRPATQSFAGAAVRVDLPASLARRLRAYSHARGLTLHTAMLAGFALLMSRYSGQHDVVVGSGVANRRMAETEQMIGMVVNTLPLRIDLSGWPGFDELTRRVHATTGRAHQWQDMPLDRLVGALAPVRDPSRNPLFQVMFSFHDSHIPGLDFAGLRGTVLERHNQTAKTDLNVVVIPRAEQRDGHGTGDDDAPVTLIWEYATDLFDAATMHAMIGHYLTLLDAAVTDPALACDRLRLLTGGQERQVLAEAAGPHTPFPAGRTIPDLFADRVAATPDALALVSDGRTWTYAELDARANQLAHLLREAGAGRDVPVGVLLERGGDLVTVLLAVVKAGAAYVPLDPAHPAERLGWMLGDVAAPVVVTRSGLAGRVGGAAGPVSVIALDKVNASLADLPASPPEPAATPASLAYVLFTSGSTGRPKGVMVEHRSVLRLVCGADYLEFGPGQRFAQVADASFDAFTFEMWGALLHGGALCVVPTDVLLTDGGLGRALRDNQVSSMFLTSALFTEVMGAHPASFAGLTNLLVGGDALNVTSVRALLGLGPSQRPARLVNGYGPTETTTFAVCGAITDVPAGAASVPIGRPIANTTGYVLDSHLRPVPPGVPGELFIGGPGVARGYANRPALTAERFLPDPFAADGSRMYRTGDIVRRRHDCPVEFLGRADNQVKIRGFRVEPGEVEAALTSHPEVGQAVVVAEDAPSGRRLVAYVVPAGPATAAAGGPLEARLRETLSATLPPYLVPAVIVALPALPMTPSGKVDRAALPAAPAALPAAAGYLAPRTETERELAELTATMLGIQRVGLSDDFFTLGGHSLLAMRLVAQSNEAFGADVALREFLAAPTVTTLAAAVSATQGHRSAAGAVAVAAPSTADEELLARLGDLSDEEVDALLRDMEAER